MSDQNNQTTKTRFILYETITVNRSKLSTLCVCACALAFEKIKAKA
jgi:hypothetical protein